MNSKKHNSKRTDEKPVEQVSDQNQNTNEISEFTSNTSASTSSSITTSPSTENKNQNNVDDSNGQTAVSNDQSPAMSQNQMITQTPIPYINYYPFIQGSNTFAAPLDFNSANWSQTMAMAKNGLSDPISVAAFINATGFNPAEITSFDQFSFAYPQAFGFGYGNPQISPVPDFQPNHRNYNKRQNVGSNPNNVQYQNFYANNSNNQKNKPNKLETEFNSLSLNDYKNVGGRNAKNSRNNQYNNQNNKYTKRYNFNNYVNNQPNLVDNAENIKLNESDNKSWTNFVGPNGEITGQMEQNRFFNNQFNYHLNQPNINNFSSYTLPEHSSELNQSSNIENQYDAQNFFKSMNTSHNQHEFNVDNNSFPPINSNHESKILQENTSKTNVPFENQNQSNYTFNKNYYKRQQYNNYQKQQQKQFGTLSNFYSNIEPDFNTYHISNDREKSSINSKKQFSEEDFYKPQHPPQLKISSFMTNLDKKFFMDDEKKNDMNPVQIDLKPNKIDTSSYNPIEFNITPISARFFVIKSYSEDDVFASIKHNVWCSTEHGNRRLNSAYIKGEGNTPVYLFFSVNGSRHFCGMAEMISRVDFNRRTELWSQDKWRGCFQVKWVYVKDVPNSLLRNIKLENNDNKPVTNSRDTQEIPFDKGIQVLKVFHTFKHTSSIFDDFDHYENTRHEEEAIAKVPLKIDPKSESQLIIPVKNDTSSSSMCSPDSSSSYGSNSNPNPDVNFDRLNQPEFIRANIGQI